MIFSKFRKTELRSDDFTSNVTTPAEWFINFLGGGSTASGTNVSSSTAIRNSTVYTCIKIIANHIAMLPIQTFFLDKQGQRIRDKKHAVAKLIETRPNPYQTPFEFKQMMEAHRQLFGNAFAEIEWGRDGYPKALWPLNPKLTTVQKDSKGKIWITTTMPNGKEQIILSYDDVLHIKGLSINGLVGLNPIAAVREQIGVQVASQEYLGKFFSNGTVTSGILKIPTQLEKPAKEKVRAEWEKLTSGLDNAHRVAILDAGLDYQALGMNQADAQFIETQKFNKTEIAQIYNVPLHMLAELDRATFSNIEQQSLEFIRDTLTPLLVSWEQTIQYQMFSSSDLTKGYYVKFNLNSMLRGDSQSRANYYKTMTDIGVYSINEVRELEDKDGIDGGDEHRVDLNHISLSIADKYQLAKAESGKGVT